MTLINWKVERKREKLSEEIFRRGVNLRCKVMYSYFEKLSLLTVVWRINFLTILCCYLITNAKENMAWMASVIITHVLKCVNSNFLWLITCTRCRYLPFDCYNHNDNDNDNHNDSNDENDDDPSGAVCHKYEFILHLITTLHNQR